MAAIALQPAQTAAGSQLRQGQEPVDGLVQAYQDFIANSPYSSDVTVEDIRTSVQATLATPGGQAYLEQIISAPSFKGQSWTYKVPGTAVLDIRWTGFTITWSGNPPQTNLSQLLIQSFMAQKTNNRYTNRPATLFYNNPADLDSSTLYNMTSSWSSPNPSDFILDFTSDAQGGKTIFRLVFSSASFAIVPGSGTGKWS